MKTTLFALAFLLTLGVKAGAQEAPLVDHWKTLEECMAGTEYYTPSILGQRKLAPDEVVIAHAIGGCADMDLPDRLGKRGFVRIAPSSTPNLVFNIKTAKVVKDFRCMNQVHSFTPFKLTLVLAGLPGKNGYTPVKGVDYFDGKPGERGEKGDKGDKGDPGQDGKIVYVSASGGFPWKKVLLWGGAIAVGGYTVYYFWPCPPGTARK